MISRKSTKLIADAYGEHFRFMGSLQENKLNVFLFEREYASWFLAIMRKIVHDGNTQKLVKALMELHTGETLVSASPTLDWQKAEMLGQKVLKKLAEDVFQLYETIPVREVDYSKAKSHEDYDLLTRLAKADRPAAEILEKLKAQLEIDGFIYRDGVLYSSESSIINEQEEQSLLGMLVNKLSLADKAVILNHLKLSEEHYLNGKWGDSISNSRNFLEAILEKVAYALHTKKSLTTKLPDRPVLVRDFLEQQSFIDSTEKDAISRVYGLISNTGSHPNIAEKDQARLMRHLALTFSQFVLLRYEG